MTATYFTAPGTTHTPTSRCTLDGRHVPADQPMRTWDEIIAPRLTSKLVTDVEGAHSEALVEADVRATEMPYRHNRAERRARLTSRARVGRRIRRQGATRRLAVAIAQNPPKLRRRLTSGAEA